MRPRRVRVLVALLACLAVVPAVSQAQPQELQDRLDRAEDRLADLDAQASVAIEDYNQAAALLDQLEARLQDTRSVVGGLEDEVSELETQSSAFVRTLYMRGPTTDLAAVLSSEEISEVGRDLEMLDRLSRERRGTLEELAARRALLDEARGELESQVTEAAQRERELADRRATVEAALAEQQADVEDLRAEIAEIERREAQEAARRAREAQEARERAEAEEQAAEETAPAPESAPAPPPPPPAPAPSARGSAQTAVDAAMSQIGKPYQWGGSGPNSYDCSGLTSWAWAHAGVSLPHSSRMQYGATTRISRADLQPGDLVFFGSPIHHVAMYIGDGNVVEAPYSGATVRVNGRAMSRGDIAGYGRV